MLGVVMPRVSIDKEAHTNLYMCCIHVCSYTYSIKVEAKLSMRQRH